MAPPSSRAGRVGPAEVAPALSVEGGSGGSASGLKDLLVSRAREFAEQGTAEALVGLPREAVKSFSRALKIVPVGWSGVEELLLARAQLLFGLSKHQACAEVCAVHADHLCHPHIAILMKDVWCDSQIRRLRRQKEHVCLDWFC